MLCPIVFIYRVRYNEIMFILGIFSWWYGAGWRQRITFLQTRLAGVMDFFSIDLLLRTLFSPFRQISAGNVQGPIGVQLQAFFDQLISRLIGAAVRLFMIIFGVISILITTVFGGLLVVAWAFVPMLPIIGVVLWVVRWAPWSL